jgi:hypothetical protein
VLALEDRKNVKAFVCGPSGSGKSELLADMFTSKAPRVLTLDATGESGLRNPDSVVVFGLAELLDAFDAAADFPRWNIVASLDDDEYEALFDLLVPKHAAGVVGLSELYGGMAIECGECDVIAPNGQTPKAIKAAWKRGRHVCLSLLMGTQRPAECDRIVTSQANYIAAFPTAEPRDLAFLSQAMGAAVAERVGRLPQYHFALMEVGNPHVLLCAGRGAARRPYAKIDRAGRVVQGSVRDA